MSGLFEGKPPAVKLYQMYRSSNRFCVVRLLCRKLSLSAVGRLVVYMFVTVFLSQKNGRKIRMRVRGFEPFFEPSFEPFLDR